MESIAAALFPFVSSQRNRDYVKCRVVCNKTKGRCVGTGVRRKPRPDGRPENPHLESVHQGDFDGNKGVYHINAVDEVTQYESVVSAQRVSESHLFLILE